MDIHKSIPDKVFKNKAIKIAGILLPIVIAAVATVYLSKILHTFNWSDIKDAVKSISHRRIIASFILVIINYFVQIGYDRFGLHYAGTRPAFKKTAAAAFIGNTLNLNLGFSAILGSLIKIRFYTRWGIAPVAVIIAIAVYSIASWLGFFSLTSVSLFFTSKTLPFFGSHAIQTITSLLLTLPVIAYLIIIIFVKQMNVFGKVAIKSPGLKTGAMLLLTGVFDWILTSVAFFVLIPGSSISQFSTFAFSFSFSYLAGILSQVPGGLAVFESAALMLTDVKKSTLLGSLFLFRVGFFIVPFIFGFIGFVFFELKYRFLNKNKPVVAGQDAAD